MRPVKTDHELFDSLIGQVSQYFLSKEKLAEVLSVSPRTIEAWRYNYPDFPARKMGKHVRYSLPEVLKLNHTTFGS